MTRSNLWTSLSGLVAPEDHSTFMVGRHSRRQTLKDFSSFYDIFLLKVLCGQQEQSVYKKYHHETHTSYANLKLVKKTKVKENESNTL